MKKNEIPKNETEKDNSNKRKKKQPEIMMSDFLSAISETEYPEYIIKAVETVRQWMDEAVNNENPRPKIPDIFSEFFGQDFDDDAPGSIEDLYRRLEETIADYADLMPASKTTGGKSDTIIISLAPPDYEGGLRAAIDSAAIFNRGNCRRVWIISDTFVLGEVVNFVPHVDALAEQGITLRFLLVTPWGWVELPLSSASASKQNFQWKTEITTKRKRK